MISQCLTFISAVMTETSRPFLRVFVTCLHWVIAHRLNCHLLTSVRRFSLCGEYINKKLNISRISPETPVADVHQIRLADPVMWRFFVNTDWAVSRQQGQLLYPLTSGSLKELRISHWSTPGDQRRAVVRKIVSWWTPKDKPNRKLRGRYERCQDAAVAVTDRVSRRMSRASISSFLELRLPAARRTT